MARRRGKPETFLITGASASRPALIDAKQRSYLIKMGIRTVCFLLAVIVFRGWLRWVLMAFAIVLPYASVVGANAVLPAPDEQPRYFVPEHLPAIEAGKSRPEEDDD